MGFSTIAAQSILFIVVIIGAVTMASVFNNFFDTLQNTTAAQTKQQESRLSTDITISAISPSLGEVNASVRNVGETTLDSNQVDVFIDGTFISRDSTTVVIESDTEVKNPGLWDPFERIKVRVQNLDLQAATTYELRVETENGVDAIRLFSTS